MLTKRLFVRQAPDPYRRLRTATLLIAIALLVGVGELSSLLTSAQRSHPFCASDELLGQRLRQDPALRRKMDEQQTAIRNYVESRRSSRIQQQSATSNLIIPVVVYVVHDIGSPISTPLNATENISDQQVNSQITALNKDFSGLGVQFCLATKQGSALFPGTTPGIIRIPSGLTDHRTIQENSLKALSTLEGDRYLRIWVVKDIDKNSGVGGYARFPGTVPPALEGIVMRYDVFGNKLDPNCNCPNLLANYDQGKILAHEVGHYLYLYHPFQGGCAGLLADCATNGDMVCDTPQIAAPDTGCPVSAASCTAAPALINNHMDYTDDTCRSSFTPDQGSRMIATINTLRPLLVSAQNLVYTGVECAGGLNASFSADNYNPCTNQTVTFNALITTGATYAWDFGDGSAGSGNSVTHTYTTAGTHTVTLTVTSGGNSVSSTQQIFLTNCTPINSTQGNWYFGDKAGLNFSTGAPVADLNSNMSAFEGCMTQSTATGSLLFYSDSVNVYDKNHVLMNPTTPLKGNTSNSQSSISIPDPTGQNRYFLFTLGEGERESAQLWYTIVNFTTSPTGTLTNVNTPVSGAGIRLTEQITAVPKCNNSGHWIIVHQRNPSRFLVYDLTPAGITGPGTYDAQLAIIGTIKASPDGTMLAQSTFTNEGVGWFGSAALYDFDRATGAITLRTLLGHGNYGCSFSPDSKLLYVAGFPPNPPGLSPIYQYDLSVQNINATGVLVAGVHSLAGLNMQLGPDKRIYINSWDKAFLSVINYPNQRNTAIAPNACGYSLDGPSLQGRVTTGGLPNMIDALPSAQIPDDFSYVISSCSTVKFSAPACVSSYAWNFGDSTTSKVQNPTHIYAANGAYTVTLTLNGATTVTHTITAGIPASSTNIFGPSQVCLGSGNPGFYNYSTNPQPGLTYNWTATGGAISGVSNSDNVDVVWNNLPGTVQLTVADPDTGCSTTSTLAVRQGSFSGTDLYMKDTMAPDLPEDFGVEPTVSQLLYISRDIWIRTSQDTPTGTSPNPGPDSPLSTDSYYANEHQHQDPTYNPRTPAPSYVYVKVRNRGCRSSTGTEKLRVYWANACTGLPWPGSSGAWKEIDCISGSGTQPCSLPVITAGQDYVVELPWMTPDPTTFDDDHFCLVARIETIPSAPFGMTSAEGPVLSQNVAGNNNIVWKNVTLTVNCPPLSLLLFNTGVADNGSLLASGAPDPHYVLLNTSPVFPSALVLPEIEGYVANSATSQWLGPDLERFPGSPSGYYTYRTTFNLPNCSDVGTAGISGQWATDNEAEIFLNGSPTGVTTGVNDFGKFTPFVITGRFRAGLNTLDFRVRNRDASDGWRTITGLRVEMSGTFRCCLLATGSLTVTKTITTPWASTQPADVFPINIACLPFGPNVNFSLSAGAPTQTVNNIPVDSTCTVTEGPLPPPFVGSPIFRVCKWTTPTYSPSQSVVIPSSGASQTVTIQNQVSCERVGSATERFGFTGGMNEFCLSGGGGLFDGSFDSPMQVDNPNLGFPIRNTGRVRFDAISLCYGRILYANNNFAFKYTFNAIPVAVLSYRDVNRDLQIPVPGSETRRNVFGAGLSPIGFQLYLRPLSRIKPFVSTSGGFIFFKEPVPRLNGARFNFTYDFGGGVQVFRDSRRAFNFGYKYQHLSSGGRVLNNPGFNAHIFYFGYSIFNAPKIAPSSDLELKRKN